MMGVIMNFMKILYVILGILVFFTLVSFLKCRGTGHIKREVNPSNEKNFLMSMEQMDRMYWHDAKSKIEDENQELRVLDIKYIEDKRTGLCFAIYKNFGFQKVPCGFLRDVL